MNSMKSVLDGARYVNVVDRGAPEWPLVAVWHGRHTVNIYAWEGDGFTATDALSVGDFAEDAATREEVVEAAERYFGEMD